MKNLLSICTCSCKNRAIKIKPKGRLGRAYAPSVYFFFVYFIFCNSQDPCSGTQGTLVHPP